MIQPPPLTQSQITDYAFFILFILILVVLLIFLLIRFSRKFKDADPVKIGAEIGLVFGLPIFFIFGPFPFSLRGEAEIHLIGAIYGSIIGPTIGILIGKLIKKFKNKIKREHQ